MVILVPGWRCHEKNSQWAVTFLPHIGLSLGLAPLYPLWLDNTIGELSWHHPQGLHEKFNLREVVEKKMGDGGDMVSISVNDAACP